MEIYEIILCLSAITLFLVDIYVRCVRNGVLDTMSSIEDLRSKCNGLEPMSYFSLDVPILCRMDDIQARNFRVKLCKYGIYVLPIRGGMAFFYTGVPSVIDVQHVVDVLAFLVPKVCSSREYHFYTTILSSVECDRLKSILTDKGIEVSSIKRFDTYITIVVKKIL